MDKLLKLVSTLIVQQYNLRTLHWKVCGTNFDPVHDLMGEYVALFDGYIDEVTEIIMMLGGYPVTLPQAISIANDVAIMPTNDNYGPKEVFSCIKAIMGGLISQYQSIYSEERIPASIVSKLQEHEYKLFLECNYKDRQRLTPESVIKDR